MAEEGLVLLPGVHVAGVRAVHGDGTDPVPVGVHDLRRRLATSATAAEAGGGSEREPLLGLAEAGRRAGREDESRDDRPHPPRPARRRAGSRSHVSLHEWQQKYTSCPDTSERYSAVPT